MGTSRQLFIRLSHRPVTLLPSQEGKPRLAWKSSSLLSPAPLRAFFLGLLLFCSPDEEVFQHKLPILRHEGMSADPAMDQSMSEVGVSFDAHDLVARPAVGAYELSRMVLSH